MFRIVTIAALSIALAGCGKIVGDNGGDGPKLAMCSWADVGEYDFGDGVDRKSELWRCMDYDAKSCYEITAVANPASYRETNCDGQVVRTGQ